MTEDWINMGYSEQEAEELHQLCENMAIAGICDIEYATESLVALIRGCNMREDEIDRWNEIGNKNFGKTS